MLCTSALQHVWDRSACSRVCRGQSAIYCGQRWTGFGLTGRTLLNVSALWLHSDSPTFSIGAYFGSQVTLHSSQQTLLPIRLNLSLKIYTKQALFVSNRLYVRYSFLTGCMSDIEWPDRISQVMEYVHIQATQKIPQACITSNPRLLSSKSDKQIQDSMYTSASQA